MSEAERKRFLATLRRDVEFRTTVRRELLIEDLLSLPQTVATLIDVVAEQRRDITALATDVRNFMERTITLVGNGFAAFQAEFAALHSEMSEFRGEMSEFRGEMSEFRSEMSEFRGEMSQFRGEMVPFRNEIQSEVTTLGSDMQAGFAAVDARFDQVDADVRDIRDRLAS